jgi:Choline-glycine betaine transporter
VFAVFPLEQLLTVVFLALIVLSIAISADTSTLVVTVLATKRTVVPTTSAVVRWDRFQGVLAVTALLVGGGETLRTVAVLTGGVFAAVSVVAILALGEYAVRAFPHEAVGVRVATAVNSQNICS